MARLWLASGQRSANISPPNLPKPSLWKRKETHGPSRGQSYVILLHSLVSSSSRLCSDRQYLKTYSAYFVPLFTGVQRSLTMSGHVHSGKKHRDKTREELNKVTRCLAHELSLSLSPRRVDFLRTEYCDTTVRGPAEELEPQSGNHFQTIALCRTRTMSRLNRHVFAR